MLSIEHDEDIVPAVGGSGHPSDERLTVSRSVLEAGASTTPRCPRTNWRATARRPPGRRLRGAAARGVPRARGIHGRRHRCGDRMEGDPRGQLFDGRTMRPMSQLMRPSTSAPSTPHQKLVDREAEADAGRDPGDEQQQQAVHDEGDEAERQDVERERDDPDEGADERVDEAEDERDQQVGEHRRELRVLVGHARCTPATMSVVSQRATALMTMTDEEPHAPNSGRRGAAVRAKRVRWNNVDRDRSTTARERSPAPRDRRPAAVPAGQAGGRRRLQAVEQREPVRPAARRLEAVARPRPRSTATRMPRRSPARAPRRAVRRHDRRGAHRRRERVDPRAARAAAAGPGDEVVYAWRSFEAYPGSSWSPARRACRCRDRADHATTSPRWPPRSPTARASSSCAAPNNPTGTDRHADEFDAFMAARAGRRARHPRRGVRRVRDRPRAPSTACTPARPRTRTSSCCAPSRRRTGSRGCASATPSATRASSTPPAATAHPALGHRARRGGARSRASTPRPSCSSGSRVIAERRDRLARGPREPGWRDPRRAGQLRLAARRRRDRRGRRALFDAAASSSARSPATASASPSARRSLSRRSYGSRHPLCRTSQKGHSGERASVER